MVIWSLVATPCWLGRWLLALRRLGCWSLAALRGILFFLKDALEGLRSLPLGRWSPGLWALVAVVAGAQALVNVAGCPLPSDHHPPSHNVAHSAPAVPRAPPRQRAIAGAVALVCSHPIA